MLDIYIQSYETFNNECWGCNSVHMLYKLASIFPHLIRIEPRAFNYPHPATINDILYGTTPYNYSDNYSIHIWGEGYYFIPTNEEELRGYNCTMGNVMREVLYGGPKLLDEVNVRNVLLK